MSKEHWLWEIERFREYAVLHDDKSLLKIVEQAELVQELKEKHKEYVSFVESNNYNMDVEMEKLYKQNKRYREALEFYADENNYEIWNSMAVRSTEINRDKGYKARKVLKGDKQ